MRFFRVSWVLSRHLIFYKLTRLRREILGTRLRLAFEELGITFIKIGQILSMRYDLLSTADCLALRQLLDDVNPISFPDIVNILEKEYQKSVDRIFAKIEERPLGSASVSQVHKGILLDGSVVAIKVKRPEVDKYFSSDMAIIKKLAAIVELVWPKMRYVRPKELALYFEQWINQDLDFSREVENMHKIAEQYDFAVKGFRPDLGRAVFPKPFEQLCTKNIIVMDFVEGIPLSRKKELLSDQNYDVKKSVKSYVVSAIRNWLVVDSDFYFQADPHFSNILALPNGDAAAVDYGLISVMTKREVQLTTDLVIAVYLRDLEQTIRIVAEMTGAEYEQCYPIVKKDFEHFLDEAQQRGFGFWFLDFAKIMVQHKLKYPEFLITFGRAACLLDGLVHEYLPGQTTLDILEEEFRREVLHRTFRNVFKANWLKIFYSLGKKINQSPKLIESFVEHPLALISELAKAVRNAVA